MSEFDLRLSQACQTRLQDFQINCGAFLGKVRGIVDDETYDVLSDAYALTGNAARELRCLIEKIEELQNSPK